MCETQCSNQTLQTLGFQVLTILPDLVSNHCAQLSHISSVVGQTNTFLKLKDTSIQSRIAIEALIECYHLIRYLGNSHPSDTECSVLVKCIPHQDGVLSKHLPHYLVTGQYLQYNLHV